MPTHIHFHDFLSDDKKPFEEAKHKRSHGKFATMAGPGAQQKNPGLREHKPPKTGSRHQRPQPQPQSRLATWGRQAQEVKAGAAARIARAVAAAKGGAGSLGKEAFASHEAVEKLTSAFASPNTPMRVKISNLFAKHIPQVIKDQIKEEGENWFHGAAGLAHMAQGFPVYDPRQAEAVKALTRKGIIKVVLGATGLGALIPAAALASGAAEHLIGHGFEHVINHVTEEIIDDSFQEHAVKFTSGVLSAGRRLIGGKRADHGFHDAPLTQEQAMKLWTDWYQTVAKSIASAPINMQKLQQNGDSTTRFGPMFGGLGGNRIGDEGTSEGAKKGWVRRQRGTKSQAPQLRKAPTTAAPPSEKPKPTFEEMRAHRDDPMGVPGLGLKLEPAVSRPKPKPAQKPVAPRATGKAPLDPSLGFRQSFNFQGKKRSAESRGSSVPTQPVREKVSLAQRGREGPAREQREVTARAQRAELGALLSRHGKGERLTEQEQHRMSVLSRIHGASQSQAVGTQQAQSPAKRFLKGKPGGRQWLSRKQ
jgi:hypothetical protein